MKSIESKIVSFGLKAPEEVPAAPEKPRAVVVEMHEGVRRPEVVDGRTYKIKPGPDPALYVTINNIVLNPGTEHAVVRPYEMFINSKDMAGFQWIVAITRLVSAVFRKGGDITFIVEELRSVFDPNGGYFISGGERVPSVVAHIGKVIEQHLQDLNILKRPQLSNVVAEFIDEKRRAMQEKMNRVDDAMLNAAVCPQCQERRLVKLDGCDTCLNCGHSKCG